MSEIEELKELLEAKTKQGKLKTISDWITRALLPIVLLAGWNLQREVWDLKSTVTAAFEQIQRNEMSNTRQWQGISDNKSTSQTNDRVVRMLQLFTVGDVLDIDKLQTAIQAMEIMEGSELTPGEIESALGLLIKVKAMNPFKAKTAPPPVPEPVRISRPVKPQAPQTEQAEQKPLSTEAIKRYIEAKKGGSKK